MKRSFTFALLLLASCSATVPVPQAGDLSCTPPPETMFGAEFGGCEATPESTEVCCTYGIGIRAAIGEFLCVYQLCRQECHGPYMADLSICLSAEEVRARKQAADKAAEHENGVEVL